MSVVQIIKLKQWYAREQLSTVKLKIFIIYCLILTFWEIIQILRSNTKKNIKTECSIKIIEYSYKDINACICNYLVTCINCNVRVVLTKIEVCYLFRSTYSQRCDPHLNPHYLLLCPTVLREFILSRAFNTSRNWWHVLPSILHAEDGREK